MGVLNGLAVPVLGCRDAGIGHIEEVLEIVSRTELLEEGHERSGIQVLENPVED
jgi:hypothetical protein